MRIETIFTNFRRSEYVETFISNKLDAFLDRLTWPDNDTHVVVRLTQSKERTDLRRPIYQCEIIVKSGMSPKTHKIIKTDRNIFKAVVACADATKVTLGRFHDRIRHDRRRRRQPEVSVNLEETLDNKESV